MYHTRIDPLMAAMVKKRDADSQKGNFGTLRMLCGSLDMPGAAVLCGLGALRSGVGLLEMTGDRKTVDRLSISLPEAVLMPFGKQSTRVPTAFVCGCGIGRQYDGLLEDILLQTEVPAVLDADCINFFALHKNVLTDMKCKKVITPHPGEMSRLTGIPVTEIQKKREETASEFAKQHGCVTLLKGHETVIASPNGKIHVNKSGCSGLSKGGSGDVLAGVIGSLMAQGGDPFESAVLGAYFHGLASEVLAEDLGEHGVIPSDLPKVIGKLLFCASCTKNHGE